MPLILYPDIPRVAGVPILPIAPIGYAPSPVPPANINTLDRQDTARTNAAPKWQIADENGNALLTPDSVIEFEYRGESHVPIFPIEKGGFASYNKVQMPFDARMTISCGGQGDMTRKAFLDQIDALRAGLTKILIVTPDATLPACNLIHVDYRRTARQGVTLILAQLWFQEIREINTGKTTTAKPDGAGVQKNGQVAPTNPTSQQAAAVGAIQ